MNKTTEQLLSQLNTMQSEHIKLLEERIEVLTKTIAIDKKTIEIQRHDNNLLLQHANSNTYV